MKVLLILGSCSLEENELKISFSRWEIPAAETLEKVNDTVGELKIFQ